MAKLLIALALITLGTSAYAENCKVVGVSDGDKDGVPCESLCR